MKIQIIQVLNRGSETIGYLCKYEHNQGSYTCGNITNNFIRKYLEYIPSDVLNAHLTDNNEIKIDSNVPILDLNTNRIIGDTKPYKTRKERAEEYIYKSKVIGNEIMKFDIVSDEDVRLISVNNKNSTGTLVIPSFITSFGAGGVIEPEREPLKRCKYTKIILDNDPNVMLNISRLCSMMDSKEIELIVRNPECITDASSLFEFSAYVTHIDISKCNIRPTKLDHMFCNCIKLKSISGLSSIDTSKAKSMEGMFKWCTSLLEVDLSGLNTSNIADLRYMFYDCSDIKHINLSDLDLSKVRRLNNAFEDCRVLVEVEFGSNKMESLEDTDSAFHNSGIEYINLGNWVTPKLVNMTDTFRSCKHLKSAILPKNTKSLEKISYLFNNCSSLEHIDLSSLHTNSIMHAKRVFAYCDSLEEINLSKFRVKNDCDITGMFNGCQKLKRLDIGNLIVNDDNTKVRKAYSLPSIIKKCNSLEEFVVPGYIIFIETLLSNLECCSNLKVLDLSYLSTKGIINDNIISRIISTLPKLNSIILPKYVDMELIKNIGNKFKQIEFTTN